MVPRASVEARFLVLNVYGEIRPGIWAAIS